MLIWRLQASPPLPRAAHQQPQGKRHLAELTLAQYLGSIRSACICSRVSLTNLGSGATEVLTPHCPEPGTLGLLQ